MLTDRAHGGIRRRARGLEIFAAGYNRSGETGASSIAGLFGLAHNLHINFYENWEEARYVVDSLDDVERFLDLLEPMA